MRWPRFAVIVLITAVLQAGLVDKIAVTRYNFTPNLLLILMVFFAIRCNQTEAIISSFVIGLALDVISTGFRMGPGIISFGLFGTFLAYMHRIITIRRIDHEAVAVFIVCFGAGVLYRLLTLSGGRAWLWPLAGSSIYSGVIGPFLFLLLDWVMSIRAGRKRNR